MSPTTATRARTCGSSSSTGRPSNSARPAVGASRPLAMRSSVDLPEPLCPNRAAGASSQKDGPSAEVQSSAAQQAAKSFWLSPDSREENKAGEGLLAQFSYLEVNRSKRSSVLQHEWEVSR